METALQEMGATMAERLRSGGCDLEGQLVLLTVAQKYEETAFGLTLLPLTVMTGTQMITTAEAAYEQLRLAGIALEEPQQLKTHAQRSEEMASGSALLKSTETMEISSMEMDATTNDKSKTDGSEEAN